MARKKQDFRDELKLPWNTENGTDFWSQEFEERRVDSARII